MAVNKVVYGASTIIDITDTTVTASKVLQGYGCYGADGEWIDGTASASAQQVVLSDISNATGTTGAITGEAAAVLGTKTITENGTYSAEDDDLDGYSEVTVDIASGGGSSDAENGIIMRTISGAYTNSEVTRIGIYAFYNCWFLATASFPAVTDIYNNAFYNCSALTTVSFPAATSIGSYAFSACRSLTTASFPSVTSIYGYAFNRCSALTTASFPVATTIGSGAFAYCSALTTASFPAVTTIGSTAFQGCSALTNASFPVATTIGSYAFDNCPSLTTVSFPVATTIYTYAFRSCFNLISLYLLKSSVATLANSSVFMSTPIAGYTTSAGQYGSIFVRESLLSTWQAATNWSYFSERFVGLTDEEIEALDAAQ